MQLEYFISGEQHTETLLCVHGAGATAHQFDQQHASLSDRYKVVSVSLRGHGGSKAPEPNHSAAYALDALAQDIITLIEALDLNHMHYIGNSAGGVLGFLVCTAIPERFLSLITFGTTGRMTLPKWMGGFVSGLDAFMLKLLGNHYLAYLAKHTGTTPESQTAIFDMFKASKAAIPYIRSQLAHYDFLDVISQLKVPYRLIQCAKDKEINGTLKATLEAMARNPQAQVILLDGVGHIANLDHPEKFNQCLLDLLLI